MEGHPELRALPTIDMWDLRDKYEDVDDWEDEEDEWEEDWEEDGEDW